MDFPYKIYIFSIIIIHFVYALVDLGILSSIPKYIYFWKVGTQIFLCLFLMYRYHPFKSSYNFKPIDSKLIFAVSLLLIVNVLTLPEPIKYILEVLSEAP